MKEHECKGTTKQKKKPNKETIVQQNNNANK